MANIVEAKNVYGERVDGNVRVTWEKYIELVNSNSIYEKFYREMPDGYYEFDPVAGEKFIKELNPNVTNVGFTYDGEGVPFATITVYDKDNIVVNDLGLLSNKNNNFNLEKASISAVANRLNQQFSNYGLGIVEENGNYYLSYTKVDENGNTIISTDLTKFDKEQLGIMQNFVDHNFDSQGRLLLSADVIKSDTIDKVANIYLATGVYGDRLEGNIKLSSEEYSQLDSNFIYKNFFVADYSSKYSDSFSRASFSDLMDPDPDYKFDESKATEFIKKLNSNVTGVSFDYKDGYLPAVTVTLNGENSIVINDLNLLYNGNNTFNFSDASTTALEDRLKHRFPELYTSLGMGVYYDVDTGKHYLTFNGESDLSDKFDKSLLDENGRLMIDDIANSDHSGIIDTEAFDSEMKKYVSSSGYEVSGYDLVKDGEIVSSSLEKMAYARCISVESYNIYDNYCKMIRNYQSDLDSIVASKLESDVNVNIRDLDDVKEIDSSSINEILTDFDNLFHHIKFSINALRSYDYDLLNYVEAALIGVDKFDLPEVELCSDFRSFMETYNESIKTYEGGIFNYDFKDIDGDGRLDDISMDEKLALIDTYINDFDKYIDECNFENPGLFKTYSSMLKSEKELFRWRYEMENDPKYKDWLMINGNIFDEGASLSDEQRVIFEEFESQFFSEYMTDEEKLYGAYLLSAVSREEAIKRMSEWFDIDESEFDDGGLRSPKHYLASIYDGSLAYTIHKRVVISDTYQDAIQAIDGHKFDEWCNDALVGFSKGLINTLSFGLIIDESSDEFIKNYYRAYLVSEGLKYSDVMMNININDRKVDLRIVEEINQLKSDGKLDAALALTDQVEKVANSTAMIVATALLKSCGVKELSNIVLAARKAVDGLQETEFARKLGDDVNVGDYFQPVLEGALYYGIGKLFDKITTSKEKGGWGWSKFASKLGKQNHEKNFIANASTEELIKYRGSLPEYIPNLGVKVTDDVFDKILLSNITRSIKGDGADILSNIFSGNFSEVDPTIDFFSNFEYIELADNGNVVITDKMPRLVDTLIKIFTSMK